MRRVTDPLLTIGAFARAVGLSASALRYYDECGLLTPAEVDDTTGYRYYTPALSQQARLVAQLRELGVPIHVMKQVLTGSPEQGRAVLRELVNAQQATTERVSSIVGQVLAELDRTPEPAGPTRATVSGLQLAAALRQVRPARAKGARTPLGCVVIDVDERGLDVVATNRHWMAVRTVNVVSSGPPTRCVLSAADAAELAERLDSCTEVDLDITGNRLIAAGGCWAGDDRAYPAHRLFLAGLEAAVTRCVLPRADLMAAVESVQRFAVTVAVDGTRCRVSRRAQDPAVEVAATVSGPPVVMHVSSTLVQRAMNSTLGPEVVWEMASPIGPLRISSPYQPGYLALLMPRREE